MTSYPVRCHALLGRGTALRARHLLGRRACASAIAVGARTAPAMLRTLIAIILTGRATAFVAGVASARGLCRHQNARLCADDAADEVDVSSLYASLQQRKSQLSARADSMVKERELVKSLGDVWPMHEKAQNGLWQHWFGEYGESAGEALQAADGDEAALTKLIEEYPDWVEPTNRLATLKYMEGGYADSVQWCLRILRNKPWHFGAASGIVMCYAKLAQQSNVINAEPYVVEANKWAKEAMPQPGKDREEWVERMLKKMDDRLEELKEME
jgi:hypothetical protein